MTDTQLRRVLRRLGLSQMELARQINVDPRTVRRWVRGDQTVPKAVEELLKAWQQLGRRFEG